MSKRYNLRPSLLLNIEDEYTAFCFDEACAYVMARLDKGDEIIREKHYSTLSEMYDDIERQG